MELQLGKTIMGFPPAAVSTICVISKWQEMDDFTNPLQHTSRWWTQIDDGIFICWRSSKRKKKKWKCFPYMQIVGSNVPKAVLSTIKSPCGARVPYAGLPHGEAAAFCYCCLSSLTWGHNGPTSAYARERLYAYGLFFLCDGILLDFWAPSTVHMVFAALWMANVSVMVKPVGQDWEVWKAEKNWMSMWENNKGWGQRQRRCRFTEQLPFVF